MQSIIWLMLATLTMFFSMGWFALSIRANQKQVRRSVAELQAGSQERKPARCKWAGWSALFLSGIFCLQADHPSMAILVWLMLIACCAFSVAMVLSFRPCWLRPLLSALRISEVKP